MPLGHRRGMNSDSADRPLHTNAHLLRAFENAWSARDVDRVMACFHEEACYFASVGAMPQAKAQGHAAIRALVTRMFAHDEGSHARIYDRMIEDTIAWWKWTYRMPDGEERLGCDQFVFRDGLIISKDAFRKSLTPPLP